MSIGKNQHRTERLNPHKWDYCARGVGDGGPTDRPATGDHVERVRIERFLASRRIDQGRRAKIRDHSSRRHLRNHVSAEARAGYIAGAGATKDQLEEIVADESLGLLAARRRRWKMRGR